MKKEFDRWNKKKKGLNEKESLIEFEEGRIYWCHFGVNVGTEMDGKEETFIRPVLVMKKFNKQDWYGVPLTTMRKEKFEKLKGRSKNFYYLLGQRNEDSVSLLKLGQVRLLNVKRIERKVREDEFANTITPETLKKVCQQFADLILI